MLWFTPPYNMAITNKLGKEFFRLLKKKLTRLIAYAKYRIGTQLR